MKIILTKTESKEFDVDESKCKFFNFDDVMMLAGKEYKPEMEEGVKHVGFKNRDEFIENINKYDIDMNEPVVYTDKGWFLCPLKRRASINKSKETADEPASAE